MGGFEIIMWIHNIEENIVTVKITGVHMFLIDTIKLQLIKK